MVAPGPSHERLDQLRQSRRADIIRRWVEGTFLTEAEMAEVADLIPPRFLVHPPLLRTGYRYEYEHYADAIGVDVRNVKRWIQAGKSIGKPPPLDLPAQLPVWWDEMRTAGVFKQSCSRVLVDYATRHSEAARTSVGPAVAAAAAVSTSGSPPPGVGTGTVTAGGVLPDSSSAKVNVDHLQAVGLSEAMRELALQLAADQKALREARLEGKSETIIARRQKAYSGTLDDLRKTEKALQDLQKARGDLAPVSQFREDLATIMSTIRGMGRRRSANVCAKLAGKISPEALELLRAALLDEQAREELQLRKARHWQRDAHGKVILPPAADAANV